MGISFAYSAALRLPGKRKTRAMKIVKIKLAEIYVPQALRAKPVDTAKVETLTRKIRKSYIKYTNAQKRVKIENILSSIAI